jgi:hypothetical protein
MFDWPASINTLRGFAEASVERANINTAARKTVGLMVI